MADSIFSTEEALDIVTIICALPKKALSLVMEVLHKCNSDGSVQIWGGVWGNLKVQTVTLMKLWEAINRAAP